MFLSRELSVFQSFCSDLSLRKRFLQLALEGCGLGLCTSPNCLLTDGWLVSWSACLQIVSRYFQEFRQFGVLSSEVWAVDILISKCVYMAHGSGAEPYARGSPLQSQTGVLLCGPEEATLL